MTQSLHTRRLMLRSVAPADAAALHPQMTWNVVQWLSGPPWPLGIDDIAGYLGTAEAAMRAGTAMHFTIVVDGRPAGAIDLRPRNGAMSLGYWLAQPYWGRGLMTEAAGAVIEAFFASDPAVHVTSGAFAGNTASLTVQKKLGFAIAAENFLFSRPRARLMPHFETMIGRKCWERGLAA